jgi:hypothetical protein
MNRWASSQQGTPPCRERAPSLDKIVNVLGGEFHLQAHSRVYWVSGLLSTQSEVLVRSFPPLHAPTPRPQDVSYHCIARAGSTVRSFASEPCPAGTDFGERSVRYYELPVAPQDAAPPGAQCQFRLFVVLLWNRRLLAFCRSGLLS